MTHFSVRLAVLCGLVLLFGIVAGLTSADAADRTPRTTALTCCERSEEAWTILRSWQRTCGNADAKTTLTPAKYAAMLTMQSRTSVRASVVRAVCDNGGLGREAVAAFFHHALCGSLPRTHGDLARSVYSVLMDEAPALDDDLVEDIVVACRGLQMMWVRQVDEWQRQLRVATDLAAAQTALCPMSCQWVEDEFTGGAYDL